MDRPRRILARVSQVAAYPEAEVVYTADGVSAAQRWLREHGMDLARSTIRDYFERRGITAGNPRPTMGETWDELDDTILREMYPDSRLPLAYIADRLKRSEASVKTRAKRLRIHRSIPGSLMPVFRVPDIRVRRPLLVIADAHVPYQHSEWLERVAKLATAWGAVEVLFAGDGFDGQALSHFEIFDDPSTLTEMEEWKRLEEAFLSRFKIIHWSLGNHEARTGRATGYKFRTADMIRGLYVKDQERVRVYDSFAVTVNRQWRVEHPKASGANVAVDIADHHLMNTAVAHTHHSSEGLTPSGMHIGVRVGAGADHTRMLYCSRITHGKYAMTNGALILVPRPDGTVKHYNLTPFSDIEAMYPMYWKPRRLR